MNPEQANLKSFSQIISGCSTAKNYGIACAMLQVFILLYVIISLTLIHERTQMYPL